MHAAGWAAEDGPPALWAELDDTLKDVLQLRAHLHTTTRILDKTSPRRPRSPHARSPSPPPAADPLLNLHLNAAAVNCGLSAAERAALHRLRIRTAADLRRELAAPEGHRVVSAAGLPASRAVRLLMFADENAAVVSPRPANVLSPPPPPLSARSDSPEEAESADVRRLLEENAELRRSVALLKEQLYSNQVCFEERQLQLEAEVAELREGLRRAEVRCAAPSPQPPDYRSTARSVSASPSRQPRQWRPPWRDAASPISACEKSRLAHSASHRSVSWVSDTPPQKTAAPVRGSSASQRSVSWSGDAAQRKPTLPRGLQLRPVIPPSIAQYGAQ
eukprot:TRINITY_DN16800_c0_g1_i1.p1 TRINITY_DN16800_c0_g1~~TRINITY_DN16800_c0_g1_i1.p1  ORF type:complete len:333 (+),score=108.21 TRINITY_DN16800_c0_g1_i1:72-1070(+)